MKKFLINRFGKEKGTEIYLQTRQRFDKLLAETPEKSKNRQKVFQNLILPRIALYQILLEGGMPKEEAMKVMEDHMIICGARPMRKKYEMIDRLPCAYSFFRFGFTHVVPGNDLWEAEVDASKKDEFSVTMHKCFWNDTYREYGFPELCQYACQSDIITYSDLKHAGFHRTQTLGTGGTCCDFCFKKIK